jgi:hypothetical protein
MESLLSHDLELMSTIFLSNEFKQKVDHSFRCGIIYIQSSERESNMYHIQINYKYETLGQPIQTVDGVKFHNGQKHTLSSESVNVESISTGGKCKPTGWKTSDKCQQLIDQLNKLSFVRSNKTLDVKFSIIES